MGGSDVGLWAGMCTWRIEDLNEVDIFEVVIEIARRRALSSGARAFLSWWMTQLLHVTPESTAYDVRRQAGVDNVIGTRADPDLTG
jgi:hypothetical protein